MKFESPKTLAELQKIICQPTNGRVDYYRGQSNYAWNITPSIARNISIKNLENIRKIENKLISNLENKILENGKGCLIPKAEGYDKSWLLWMAAQHYGLPTRLLDFSHDIFTALQFAVANRENLNHDGALIIYSNADQVQEELSIISLPFDNDYAKSFFLQAPSFGSYKINECILSERRKLIQRSKFLYRETKNIYQCLSLDWNHGDNLTMVYIPKNIKIDIIKWLIETRKMAYDLYAGKNLIDYYASIFKIKFNDINENNIQDYLKNDEKWKC